MTHKKVPTYLTDEQRQIMMEIPTGLDDRDLARYYTLTAEELDRVLECAAGMLHSQKRVLST